MHRIMFLRETSPLFYHFIFLHHCFVFCKKCSVLDRFCTHNQPIMMAICNSSFSSFFMSLNEVEFTKLFQTLLSTRHEKNSRSQLENSTNTCGSLGGSMKTYFKFVPVRRQRQIKKNKLLSDRQQRRLAIEYWKTVNLPRLLSENYHFYHRSMNEVDINSIQLSTWSSNI